MSDVDDLITWLRAQLDEDERIAQAAGACAWGPLVKAGYPTGHDAQLEADEEHTALHDPARVLAEVDAKRRILDFFEAQTQDNGWFFEDAMLKLLALPYAGRPGYRDEWKP